jgi:sugar/nucleoside kinase (ribokinase family)
MRIATVGVHVLDIQLVGVESIPEGSQRQLVDQVRISPAGTAGGTGVILSRLGAEVHAFGAVGGDPVSALLVALLGREGIDIRGLVRHDAEQTATSVMPVRPSGERPAWHCIGANGAFTLDDIELTALDGITHLHLGGPELLGGDPSAKLLTHARSLGAVTSVDLLGAGEPGLLDRLADTLPHIDYLLPDEDQVLGLTGAGSAVEGARALLESGVGCVALTRGAAGALVVTPDSAIEVPAYDVPVRDTTGCGEAFSAGFLRGRALGRDLRGAAELGCAVAAQVAQGFGTDAGDYSLRSVEDFAATAPRRG